MEKYDRETVGKLIETLAQAYKTGWHYEDEGQEAGSVIAACVENMFLEGNARQQRIWDCYEALLYNMISMPDKSKSGSVCWFYAQPKRMNADRQLVIQPQTKITPVNDGQAVFYTQKEYGIGDFHIKAVYYAEEGRQLVIPKYREEHEKPEFDLKAAEEQNLLQYETDMIFENAFDGLKNPVFCLYFDVGEQELKTALPYFLDHHAVQFSILFEKKEYSVIPFVMEGRLYLRAKDADFTIYEDRLGEAHTYILRAKLLKREALSDTGLKNFVISNAHIKYRIEPEKPDQIYTDEGSADGKEEVLLFGSSLEPASMCYIGSNAIFSKASAEVRIRFQCGFKILEDKLPEYNIAKKTGGKYRKILDALSAVDLKTEDCYPGRVRVEYFNGEIWTSIPKEEDFLTVFQVNEFWVLGHMVEHGYSFIFDAMPDWKPCVIEGEKRYWLRFRLVDCVNANAAYKRRFIPYIKDVKISCHYGEQSICAKEILASNAVFSVSTGNMEKIPMFLAFTQKKYNQALWFCFDKCPPSDAQMSIQINGIANELIGITDVVQKTEGDEVQWWFALDLERFPYKNERVTNIFLNVFEGKADDCYNDAAEAPPDYMCAGYEEELETVRNITPILFCTHEENEERKKQRMREYLRRFGRIVTKEDLEMFLKEKYEEIETVAVKDTRKHLWLDIGLREGKNDRLFTGLLQERILEDLQKENIDSRHVTVRWREENGNV